MPRYKKLKPGGGSADISASTWNALVDMLIERDATRPSSIAAAKSEGEPLPSGQIYVRNTSSSTCPRFGVLGIKGPSWTPTQNLNSFQNQICLDCVTPTSSYLGKFVIPIEPILVNCVGRAVISGKAICQVTGTVAASGLGFADVLAGDNTQLKCGTGTGAQILWADSGTSTRWALVRLGAGGNVLLGKLTTTLSQGSYATVEVYGGTPNSETDQSYSITAYDWLMKSGATALAIGTNVVCQIINGVWYVTAARCQ